MSGFGGGLAGVGPGGGPLGGRMKHREHRSGCGALRLSMPPASPAAFSGRLLALAATAVAALGGGAAALKPAAADASRSAAAAALKRHQSRPCPEGFTCLPDGPSFAKALKDAPGSAKLALLCAEAAPCTISGQWLGFVDGVAATVIMEFVTVRDNDCQGGDGCLLNIAGGNVTGRGLTFRGGAEGGYGGCVANHQGRFACTDCVFEDCVHDQGGSGGGVFSGGTLSLVRAQFINNTCDGCDNPWGAGCWCEGDEPRKCAGCTCATADQGNAFYCPNGPVQPTMLGERFSLREDTQAHPVS